MSFENGIHITNEGRHGYTLTVATDHSKTVVDNVSREELAELFRELVDDGFTTDEINRLQEQVAELKAEIEQVWAGRRADLDSLQAQIAAALNKTEAAE